MTLHRVALTALLAAALPACGTAPEEPTATPSASEATPTATPTPAALDDWYALTSLAIAPEREGLDLDADGQGDNKIYAALRQMEQALVEGVDEILNGPTDYPGPPDVPCEETPTGCGLPQPPAPATEIVEALADLFLNVDTLNAALATEFEGGARPYALHGEGRCPDNTLSYYRGEATAAGYVPGALLGVQGGDLCAGDALPLLGPGDLSYAISLTPPVGEPVELGFTVYQVQTQIDFGGAQLSDVYAGGGVKVIALLDLAAALLDALPETVNLTEEQVAALLADLEATLTPLADIPCGDGDACVSVTFTYDADATALAP